MQAPLPTLRLKSAGALRPQPLRGELGALDQRGELRPGDVRVDIIAGGGRRKTAVVAGDDVLAADDACKALDALRDQLGVLDLIDAVRDHARNKDLAGRQLDLPPDLPFVL